MASRQSSKVAVEAFISFMENHQMRKTPERLAVLDRILKISGHFSIEQLYSDMEKSDYHVSRATIYNTVNLLSDAGILIRHQFGDGPSIYEPNIEPENHSHLVCRKCGRIQEISDPDIDSLLYRERYANFSPDYAELTIYGLCKRCARHLRPTSVPSERQLKKIENK